MAFFHYVFGPKLYMEYGTGNTLKYESSGLEKVGDQIISTLSVMWNLSYYTSPIIVSFLYRRGYFVAESISSFAKFTTSIGIIVIISLCLRGIGRAQSRPYVKLSKALEMSKNAKNKEEGKAALRKFDFEFSAWPVDFDVVNATEKKGKSLVKSSQRSFRLASLPCQIAAYIAIKTFGIKMIYPGSIRFLQNYMRHLLVAGRARLIEEEQAQRFKIKTVDHNEIDTIFVDNRQKNSTNGKTLVVCSEGNAGFYEIGIMATPLEKKYSVLGWNHPGFEGSTGTPYPNQDNNAVDAVMQFAINGLGFAVEDIILYGWSIGGYSSLYAASLYTDVKGVIVDASFDDIMHLAQSRMPACLAGIVRIAIRDYCNLNNLELLAQYQGPILLIRRTEDEIIADDNRIETNRGNFLLIALLKQRYPHIFKDAQLARLKMQLSKPVELKNFNTSEDDLCLTRIMTYASDQGKSFPMLIGEDYNDATRTQMADYLLCKHFRDFKATHCTPLASDYINIPWDIPIEQGFVFT